MCSDTNALNNHLAIKAEKLTKIYPIFDKPIDRLKQFFWLNKRRFYRPFTALGEVSFELNHGDILGIIGRNGSGKSTLLQLVAKTLTPTSGQLQVDGRVAALLELGAGFNPEFSGRENVYLNASILGLTQDQIDERFDEIVEFSGIREFIDQPVKTYSSGMYVRLAFSVAVCVDPDILIIDEALSVGDGAFARRSFEKIMELKRAGKTILFCSHSMYQIEALCNKVIWLEKGEMQKFSTPAEAVVAYNQFLDDMSSNKATDSSSNDDGGTKETQNASKTRFVNLVTLVNGQSDNLVVNSEQSTLTVVAQFVFDKTYGVPTIGVAIVDLKGNLVTSCTSKIDNFEIPVDEDGIAKVKLEFPNLALLKGFYTIDVYLACENAIHVYEHATQAFRFEVIQNSMAQGVVSLPHLWSQV